MSKNIVAKIGYPDKKKDDTHYKTKLGKWLSKELDFYPITHANFSKDMVCAVVEFGKDHCIYVLMERDNFKKEV